MSHLSSKSAYKSLEERLNRFPQGAPPSVTLYKILETLFSEKEAELVAKLPIKPFDIKKASSIWKLDIKESQKILEDLTSRCILMDVITDEKTTYLLPPPMAGFLEFSMMRTRNDINQHLLAELFYQYMNIEEDFIKQLFFSTETRLGRTFINESVLTTENMVNILDFEKASFIIEDAKHIGIGMCYCRHKMEHLGKNCNAPIENICMTFGNVADSLIRHDYAKRIDKVECLEILHMTYEHNLVQCGENVKNDITFICNCCGCCCEALVASNKFGYLHPIETTGFIPILNIDNCIGCGKCEKVCQINAIKTIKKDENLFPEINIDICLGCGLCARACHNKSIVMKKVKNKILTPENSVHRTVLMAIEKGQLQELIFDNKALFNHRAMAAILSAILKLSPLKKIMATNQFRSNYLNKLIKMQKI